MRVSCDPRETLGMLARCGVMDMPQHSSFGVPLRPFLTSLKDGRAVHVRKLTPEDRALVETGFADLSDGSRRKRFLSTVSRLTEAQLRDAVRNDAGDYTAIGATIERVSGPAPAGLARYVRLAADRTRAELALTVMDDYQQQGLGSLLVGVLAKMALVEDVNVFIAVVDQNNWAMRRLLLEAGGQASPIRKSVELPLFRDASWYPDTRVGHSFRAAYALANTAAV